MQSPHGLCPVLHWDIRHRPELQLWQPDASESELVRSAPCHDYVELSPVQRELREDQQGLLQDPVAGEPRHHSRHLPARHPGHCGWDCRHPRTGRSPLARPSRPHNTSGHCLCSVLCPDPWRQCQRHHPPPPPSLRLGLPVPVLRGPPRPPWHHRPHCHHL